MKPHFTLNRTTEAVTELFTLAEARLFLKIPDAITADDKLIGGADAEGVADGLGGLIEASRLLLQNYLNRSILNEVWNMKIDGQPDRVGLPMGYVSAVASVKTYQDDSTATITESATTTYDTILGDFGSVFLRPSASWRSSDKHYAIMEIVYTAGYGTTIPTPLILAAYEVLAVMYLNRSSVIEIPLMAKEMIQGYRIYSL